MEKRYIRQMPLYAAIAFTFADTPSGTFVPMIEVPPKAIEVDGFVEVTTAFNGVTTDAVTVGSEADPDSHLASTSVKAVGRTALTGLEGPGSAKRTIGVTRTDTGGSATAGAAILVLGYIEQGRKTENYGQLDGGPVGS